MASTTGDLDRLSGVVLPLILQRKLESQQEQAPGEEKEERKASQDGDNDTDALPDDDARANSIFSTEELEENAWKTRAAIADIQKQLMRGEESYHEETNGHGNLFRGWPAEFIDAKDTVSTTTGSRRLPADNRWFSGSCASDGRMPRPMTSKNLASNRKAGPRSSTNTPNPSSDDVSSRGATAVNAVDAGSIPSGGVTTALGVQSSLPAGADSHVQRQMQANTSGTTDASSGRRTRKRKASDA